MCGRYFANASSQEVAAAVKVDVSLVELAPSYNVAPTNTVPVVRFDAKNGERALLQVHWGLIPHFAKDRKMGYKTINARAETVDTAPSFRTGFAKRRCLVVASGFFEWKKVGKKKLPHAFSRSDYAVLGMAGVRAAPPSCSRTGGTPRPASGCARAPSSRRRRTRSLRRCMTGCRDHRARGLRALAWRGWR